MSWDPSFVVRLVDPTDRDEAITIARRLAQACHLRRCRLTSDDATLVAAIVRAQPRRLELALEAEGSFVLPPMLLRGVADSIDLAVFSTEPRPPVHVRMARDQRGEPVTAFEILPGPPEVREPYVRECIALAHGLGMLTTAPDTAFAQVDLAARTIAVPVYADAFPILASELIADRHVPYITLAVEVEPAHAAELIATIPTALSVMFTLHVELDDDSVFGALCDLPDVPGSELVLRWEDPDDAIWIPFNRTDGSIQNDGRIYSVSLNFEHPACEIIVTTVIDHAGLENTEAWLAERAGAPVAYRDPRSTS